jgi:hypothetical protein
MTGRCVVECEPTNQLETVNPGKGFRSVLDPLNGGTTPWVDGPKDGFHSDVVNAPEPDLYPTDACPTGSCAIRHNSSRVNGVSQVDSLRGLDESGNRSPPGGVLGEET